MTYPALFYFDPDESVSYFVHFPDFPNSATQGKTISDAMMMASDYLGIIVADMLQQTDPVPAPTDINQLSLINNNPFKDDPDFKNHYDMTKSFISMVTVDLSSYLAADKPIKKTLTIPNWADKLGKKLKLNFSQTLTDAITDISLKSGNR